MDLLNIAHRVKRGAKLLDRKIPNWRQILRKHADQFDFENGSHCVLGTLEHYSGRMAVLKKRRGASDSSETAFGRACTALNINGKEVNYGFERTKDCMDNNDCTGEYAILSDLWKAEAGIEQ